ncbi:MAG: hypothetical protein GY940_18115 [bacterium]|nr:hypothetical protein [bacterium]
MLDTTAVEDVKNAIKRLHEEGGRVFYGGDVIDGPQYGSGTFPEIPGQYRNISDTFL